MEGEGPFDIIIAHAVLQFQPHRIENERVTDLSRTYPFERFDRQVSRLCEALAGGGLLSIVHAHYRIEDSSCFAQLAPLTDAPVREDQLFDRDSRLMKPPLPAGSMFIKSNEGFPAAVQA
jgi:hypothetical protein